MPHCVIEITNNLFDKSNANNLMQEVANAIFSLGCFKADDIKVRIYPVEHSFMGTEEQKHSYVTTDVLVLTPKTEEQLNKLTSRVHATIEPFFTEKIGKNSITTRVSLTNKAYYRKTINY